MSDLVAYQRMLQKHVVLPVAQGYDLDFQYFMMIRFAVEAKIIPDPE